MFDLIIVGAGPAGISAAWEAQKLGLDYLVIEKGLIANTIYNYPIGLTVFSTPNELELIEGQLKPIREKPTREELLSYYVRFVLEKGLRINTEEKVEEVERLSDEVFSVKTTRGEYFTRKVLFAIGAMEHPKRLGVPGEDLPKVYHTFRETYPFVRKKVMVVGGGNSAGEAALFLAQEGAETTLAIFREDWENTDPKKGCIKYWVKQPLQEQLEKGCLQVFFLKRVVEIRNEEVVLEGEDGVVYAFENDFVFVLIGAEADLTLLKRLGVRMRPSKNPKYGEVPVYDEETFETNIPGVYVAGHFTEEKHIAGAIKVPRRILPKIAESLSLCKSI
ncbi:MAG: NAD(P)-binding domain-containing protein [Pyrinomonadaceae bacterium]|nr:NAD(P)-binding domain-containing protein [Pyrinomonadaceae bacterium]